MKGMTMHSPISARQGSTHIRNIWVTETLEVPPQLVASCTFPRLLVLPDPRASMPLHLHICWKEWTWHFELEILG